MEGCAWKDNILSVVAAVPEWMLLLQLVLLLVRLLPSTDTFCIILQTPHWSLPTTRVSTVDAMTHTIGFDADWRLLFLLLL